MVRLASSLLCIVFLWVSLTAGASARVLEQAWQQDAWVSDLTGANSPISDFGFVQDAPPGDRLTTEGMEVGPNLYAYVRQNPWTSFDPDGLVAFQVANPHAWSNPQIRAITSSPEYQKAYDEQAQYGALAFVAAPLAIYAAHIGVAAVVKEVVDEVFDQGFEKLTGFPAPPTGITDIGQKLLKEGGEKLAKEGGEKTAKDIAKQNDAVVKKQLPNDAVVIRGGKNTPEQIASGTGTHPEGVTGVSVESAPGASVEELAETAHKADVLPHGQVGTTTVGQVRGAGGNVIPTKGKSPNHATMTGLSPEKASELLTPTIPNPAKKK